MTDRTLAESWDDIQEPYPRSNAKHQIAALEQRIEVFNDELVNRLVDLRPKVREILGKFGYKVDLNLDSKAVTYNQKNKTLENQQILLNVKFFDKDISKRYLLLNEAKLSAIAIAIYFSSILCLPEPENGPKILALDDVLIGLDMSNRFPVLDILGNFKDYQIFLTTYDKAWYEIVKQRTDQTDWKYAEFYFGQTDEYEIPVYVTRHTLTRQESILVPTTTKLVLSTSVPLLKRQSSNIARKRISLSSIVKTQKT